MTLLPPLTIRCRAVEMENKVSNQNGAAARDQKRVVRGMRRPPLGAGRSRCVAAQPTCTRNLGTFGTEIPWGAHETLDVLVLSSGSVRGRFLGPDAAQWRLLAVTTLWLEDHTKSTWRCRVRRSAWTNCHACAPSRLNSVCPRNPVMLLR